MTTNRTAWACALSVSLAAAEFSGREHPHVPEHGYADMPLEGNAAEMMATTATVTIHDWGPFLNSVTLYPR